MIFSSVIFLFGFLPLVLAAYLLSPRIVRNVLLLLASLIFYAWGETFYVALMGVSCALNYLFGLWIDRTHASGRARTVVGIAVATNLGILAWFKYANFVVANLNELVSGTGSAPLQLDPVHLPLGISFFTFQAISYVIDVYRRDGPPERNPLHVALYISLFPQLIAGPIVRFRDIARELTQRESRLADVAYGMRRFIVGLAKKVLIANVMARSADSIFAMPPEHLTFGLAWLGAVSYTLQIYFDFSGYSDMAIGLGRMFGFHFLENFNYPYISRSLTEFWRRWHISLSTWFRDYLYIPLGGNQRGSARTYTNLLLVFLLCGLWHGASWTFVIWGLYHGGFLVLERLGRGRSLPAVPGFLQHVYALLVVVVGWVIFRCESAPQTVAFLTAMAGMAPEADATYYVRMYVDSVFALAMGAGLIGSTPILPALIRAWERRASQPGGWTTAWATAGSVASLASLGALLILSLLQVSSGTHNPFIYFRF